MSKDIWVSFNLVKNYPGLNPKRELVFKREYGQIVTYTLEEEKKRRGRHDRVLLESFIFNSTFDWKDQPKLKNIDINDFYVLALKNGEYKFGRGNTIWVFIEPGSKIANVSNPSILFRIKHFFSKNS